MCPDLSQTTHRFEPEDTFGDILFLKLYVCHLKDRVLSGVNNALLCAKAEFFSTTRDRKRKFEVPEGLPVFKDLHGHPVLKGDVGHVGSVLSVFTSTCVPPGHPLPPSD